MDKIKEITIVNEIDGAEEIHVIIDRGNGEFTSMLKETYDAQQAEHLNGNGALVNAEQL